MLHNADAFLALTLIDTYFHIRSELTIRPSTQLCLCLHILRDITLPQSQACGLIFQETESGWMGGGGSTRTRRVGAIYAPFSDTSWLASFLHSFFGLVIRSGRAIEYLWGISRKVSFSSVLLLVGEFCSSPRRSSFPSLFLTLRFLTVRHSEDENFHMQIAGADDGGSNSKAWLLTQIHTNSESQISIMYLWLYLFADFGFDSETLSPGYCLIEVSTEVFML